MNIVVIAKAYPIKEEPVKHVFLKKLVEAFANNGHNCYVIRPVSIFDNNLKSVPYHSVEKSEFGTEINIYFPRYLKFWWTKKNKFDFIQSYTLSSFTKTVTNTIKKEIKDVDLLYGHFLMPSGISVSRIGREFTNAKSVVAFGESTLWSIAGKGGENFKKELNTLDGIVAVSSQNKRILIDSNIKNTETIEVFPNGVDLKKFYVQEKNLARRKFGFNEDDFIVSFVGSFSERKGVLRVAQALDNLEGVSTAFAGKGELKPNIANTIYQDIVYPEDMTDFLSASDVFVLPTLNEGCCNAIIEAMACGLPIVSSNLPFNDDILNTENSIRVDPNNIEEIRQAVLKIKNDDALRQSMSKSSIESAKSLNINKRAENILNWIETL